MTSFAKEFNQVVEDMYDERRKRREEFQQWLEEEFNQIRRYYRKEVHHCDNCDRDNTVIITGPTMMTGYIYYGSDEEQRFNFAGESAVCPSCNLPVNLEECFKKNLEAAQTRAKKLYPDYEGDVVFDNGRFGISNGTFKQRNTPTLKNPEMIESYNTLLEIQERRDKEYEEKVKQAKEKAQTTEDTEV